MLSDKELDAQIDASIAKCDEMGARLDRMEEEPVRNRYAASGALAYVRAKRSPIDTSYGAYTRDFDVQVKEIDEDLRILRGTATSGTRDRMGDVVEPEGASFAAEIPLLLGHDPDKPVGSARLGTPTSAGIPFEAFIARVEEPRLLKDRCNEAWHSVKAKLIRSVSIGFNAVRTELLPDRNGIRYLEIEILELSLVAIPAQPDATITSFKSATPITTSKPRREARAWPFKGMTQEALVNRFADRFKVGIESYSKARNELDAEYKRKEQHEVTLTQAHYSVLRQLPWLAAQEAASASFFMAFELVRQLAEEQADTVKTLVGQELEKAFRLDARLKALEETKYGTGESVQRQLSRHAEHLRRLEDWKKEHS